jgi:hypothetical protein
MTADDELHRAARSSGIKQELDTDRRTWTNHASDISMDRDRTVKTATARATEAIEAAEMMFADEMGATLDLSPAARMALIEKIAAAIQTAVA